MSASIELGGRRVSADDPCYVIAEVGVNHNGDADLAHKMIDAAKEAGADAVKFQTYKTDALITANTKKADYQTGTTGEGSQDAMLRKLELPQEVFGELAKHCREVGVDFMSTAFDSESLEAVSKLAPVCLKWPSGELTNTLLLRQAAQYDLPILLSTGMGTLTEISTALDLLAAHGTDDVVILQCVSNYPAAIEEQNLRVLPHMAAVFGKPTGFSDHTEGPYAALAARALGMSVLEKHFTMDRTMEGPDHRASIEPAEFGQMVTVLRQVEQGLGDGVKRRLQSEQNILSVARKSLVYLRDLPAGHVLDLQDLTAKRPGTGLPPDEVDSFIGRTLAADVTRDEQVQRGHVR
ncbi:N-acetylneuraminate synthase family protein [Tropicibacter sp. Alg240-R139]|uniref:N-acetylneuraminate synthase family protein n=1 Tax=Tropicibacter sp. Alg240-R139 TaxID=2305991 RepID=UPI0013DF174F|nr:N-acetylneuraminate synthase family protein [Tropicibacter sp. Alg240-R139]